MKNIILTLTLLILTSVGYSQTDSIKKDDVFCLNTELDYDFSQSGLQNIPSKNPTIINLRLKSYKNRSQVKAGYTCLLLAGIAFTTASLLEGGYGYGTWTNNLSSSSPNSTYVTPSFWSQTPRQIMFCVGVGFTLTGGIGMMADKKKDY